MEPENTVSFLFFSTEKYYNITAKNYDTYWKIPKHQKRKITILGAWSRVG